MRNPQLFDEEDFLQATEGEIKNWLFDRLDSGRFTSFDGTQLQYYYVTPPEARATIVIFHGFCEFIDKYHEMMYYMYREGYSVYLLEQRGHGHSDHLLKELDIVHIGHFDDYIKDQHLFIEKIVMPYYRAPLFAFAHSMGGNVLAQYLETYPDTFQAAILSSPMLGFMFEDVPSWQIKLLVALSHIPAVAKKLGPGQRRFTPVPDFENSSTSSRARYDYVLNARIKDPMKQTAGGTVNWGVQSLHACEKAIANASKIKVPVLLFQAIHDGLVNPSAQTRFAALNPLIEMVSYDNTKHEIFNGPYEVRQDYYEKIFEFYETH